MQTSDHVRKGQDVFDSQDTKLGTVERVEDDKAFVPYQGGYLAIPLDAISGIGSNHLTLNHTATNLPASWKQT